MLFPYHVNGNIISYEGDFTEAYTKFRKAIMDAELPVTMPIGFKIVTDNSMDRTSAIVRNDAALESMVAVSCNVKDIVMVGTADHGVQSNRFEGIGTTGNLTFVSNAKPTVQVIDKTQHIVTAISPLLVRFFVNKAAGYHSMEENAKIIKKGTEAIRNSQSYFPLNTTHSLESYIKVLPMADNQIRVRYTRGMTADLFQQIIDEANKGD